VEIFFNIRPLLDWHHDFLAFYSAGSLIWQGQANGIFNQQLVSNFEYGLIHQKVGAAGYMAYINPPFVAVLLAPLGAISFFKARIVWFLLNLILVFFITSEIVRPIEGWRKYLSWAVLLSIFPIYQALAEGQPSIIILGTSLGALKLFKSGSLLTGGLFLAGLVIKPQLAAPIFLGLILFRQWKVVFGMALGTLVLIAGTLPFVGVQSYLTYIQYLLGVTIAHFNGAGLATTSAAWHGDIRNMSGLNSFWVGLFGQTATVVVNVLTALSILGLILMYYLAARKSPPGFGSYDKELMIAASIGLILLTDLHLYAQDLVVALIIVPIIGQRLKDPLLLLVPLALLLDVVAIDPLLPIHVFPLAVVTMLLLVFRTDYAKAIQISAS
jgi:Glycosyltransferase family 87